jgi:mRNA interferase HicA
MKHRDLVKKFEDKGWSLKREGSNHEIYTDGNHDEKIPRHKEINEQLAKTLIKKWGL